MNIYVEKLNEVFLHVYADDMGVEAEIEEFFTYDVPNARFMPKVKAGIWDGKMRLADPIRKTLYTGLYDYLVKFAENRGYYIKNINELQQQNQLLYADLVSYTDKLNYYCNNKPISPYDYQIDAIYAALTDKRKILVSPTGSGKSLIIYTICRWMIDQQKKCIIIVPTTSLVEQMFGDFKDYASRNGWDVNEHCTRVYGEGDDKDEQIFTITIDNNIKIYLRGNEYIKTINRGEIKTKHLKVGDDIDDQWLYSLQTYKQT